MSMAIHYGASPQHTLLLTEKSVSPMLVKKRGCMVSWYEVKVIRWIQSMRSTMCVTSLLCSMMMQAECGSTTGGAHLGGEYTHNCSMNCPPLAERPFAQLQAKQLPIAEKTAARAATATKGSMYGKVAMQLSEKSVAANTSQGLDGKCEDATNGGGSW